MNSREFSSMKRSSSVYYSNRKKNLSAYEHPLGSRILSKADNILKIGMKYKNNLSLLKPKNSSNIKITRETDHKISFNSLLRKHHQKREDWMEMTQKESNQLNESFKDLDGIQSDEIEKKVPVQIETEKIIDGFDEDLLSCLNSDIKENRIKLVEDNEREEEVENLNIPKPEALPEVRPNSIPEKELLPMTKSTQISYHRENMMKEVNEMIGELQVILKPKTEETFESSISEPPKVLSKSSDSPVKKSIIKE